MSPNNPMRFLLVSTDRTKYHFILLTRMWYVNGANTKLFRLPNFVLRSKQSEKPAIFDHFFILGPRKGPKKQKSAWPGHRCLYGSHDDATYQISDSQEQATYAGQSGGGKKKRNNLPKSQVCPSISWFTNARVARLG